MAGGLAGHRGRWAIGVAGADRASPRLIGAHLATQGDHPPLLVQQKQIAVAAHQFQHQAALEGLARPGGEAQLHHPVPAPLLQAHQGQTAQSVLELLRQGAALPLARRGRDQQ